MNKERVKLEGLKLVGLTTRTNNKDEMTSDKGKIGPLANQYWSNQTGNNFKHRTNPGVTYCVANEPEKPAVVAVILQEAVLHLNESSEFANVLPKTRENLVASSLVNVVVFVIVNKVEVAACSLENFSLRRFL